MSRHPKFVFPDSETVGILEPPSHYQRYRRSEFPEDKPFFQWWFFTIADHANDRYFAITHYVLDCVSDLRQESVRVNFAMTAKQEDTLFHKVIKYPITNFSVRNDFDVTIAGAQPGAYTIEVIDEDTYRLRGTLRGSPEATAADGRFMGKSIDPALPIEWDLTFYRLYGWYGQRRVESWLRFFEAIGWNTYAHATQVEGTIKVGDVTHDIARKETCRGYADQNWGIHFPAGRRKDKAVDFPWGWYYVELPDTDLGKELSIVAGVGRQYYRGFGILEGKFASVRLNATTHIEAAAGYLFKRTPDSNGLPLEFTNDGKLFRFEVECDQWADYQDAIGIAAIPLQQKVTLETDHYLIALDFHSTLDRYTRLVCPHEDYAFSDFEALGVDVHVTVEFRWLSRTYRWWDIFHWFAMKTEHRRTLFDFWSKHGGLEYGYVTHDVRGKRPTRGKVR